MDLNLFLSAVDAQVFEGIQAPNTFFRHIQLHHERMPDYRKADIAIIGLQEIRGAQSPQEEPYRGADIIRRKLYELKKGSGPYNIVDLGNLRNGLTLEETYRRIKEVCRLLLEAGTLPLLIGGSHDLAYGQFQAYEDLQKNLTVLNIDAAPDMEAGEQMVEEQKHLQRMIMHEPNYLFNLIQMGHQTYLTDPYALKTLEKLNFDLYRLGQVRADIEDIEPVIRNAHMMSFDLTAIKVTDAPATANGQIFGFNGEEACQLCWYAGQNTRLSSVGFYGYCPPLDDEHQRTAALTAIMSWYFIEGFYNRKDEPQLNEQSYLKYVVTMEGTPREIVFYKSKLSDKWWMEVPSFEEQSAGKIKPVLLPCNYNDYQSAQRGQIPERMVNALARLV